MSAVRSASPLGRTGVVTTTIPAGALGEVKVAIDGGTSTYHAYASRPDTRIPSGTWVRVKDVSLPRTVYVEVVDTDG